MAYILSKAGLEGGDVFVECGNSLLPYLELLVDDLVLAGFLLVHIHGLFFLNDTSHVAVIRVSALFGCFLVNSFSVYTVSPFTLESNTSEYFYFHLA